MRYSIPEHVMRSGAIQVFDPRRVRRDITERDVENTVRLPIGRKPGVSGESGVLSGADADGRPVRQFEVAGMPSTAQAMRAVDALKSVAAQLRSHGLDSAVTPLVGGPLASLARGEAVVLRFTNGVAISAAL